MAGKKTKSTKGKSTASLGFEAKLWSTADKLRNNMDAAEHRHVALRLIILKYISDTFEEHRAKLMKGEGTTPSSTRKTNRDTLYRLFADTLWSNKERLSDALLIGLIAHFSSL
jgi:type I restriction enzyme M protein